MRLPIAAAAIAAIILALGPPGPAKADPYRWCAVGVGQDGASNCYFLTLDQCQASASGTGAICRPNGFYTGPDAAPRHAGPRR